MADGVVEGMDMSEPNAAEVSRDARIKAAAARLKAREDAEILAQATAQVEAELAAEAEAARIRADEERNAKAHAETRKARSAAIKNISKALAAWMVDNDTDDIYSAPIDAMRKAAGL
jgi:hypothetical protein